MQSNIKNNIAGNIARNITDVRQKIASASAVAHRDPSATTLIAVSKNHGVDAVRAAFDCGITHFGENKLQEATTKFASENLGDDLRQKITLHFIGHLQSNKVKQAVRFFDYIHSLDRKSVADAMANEKKNWQAAQPFPKLLIEVNVGQEPQKSGVMPGDIDQFYNYCAADCGLAPHIVGLMAILPLGRPVSPYFTFLKQRAGDLKLPETSMGMTGDYVQAIELGATMVRIGTGIFGGR